MTTVSGLPIINRKLLEAFIKDPKTLLLMEALFQQVSEIPYLQEQAITGLAAVRLIAEAADNTSQYLYFGGPMLFPFGLRADTVANINVAYPPYLAGQIAYATNGRKNGEGPSAGTGVMCFRDATNWIACDSGTVLAA